MAVKRLGELTIDELKKELKKRGLDLNGDRNELMARLKKALSDEKKSQASQLPAVGNSSLKEKIPAAAVNQPARRAVQAEATKSMEYVVDSTSLEERPELEYSGAEFGAGVDSSVMSGEYESGGMTREEEEAAKKATDDPPLDLMVDESQNDFDDDIVCVSVTPGKGYLVPSEGQMGRGDARKIEGKPALPGAERTTPNQGSNTGSAEDRKISGQGDSKDLGIWISGLTPACRAADLKALFNKCGKVTGAKIVASAKAPASKCFGIVMMASHVEVQRCLKELNGTTLHGNTLTLELYSGRRSTSSAKPSTSTPTPTLWVTGIGLNTKAADLKKLFLPHGRVVAATIVMNPASGGARRGLIKMATCEEADVCVQKLNKTPYVGHTIEVERAKGNATQPEASKSTSKPATSQPPSLMTQKSSPSETSKPRSSFYGSSASSSRRNRSRDRSNRFRAARPRRAFSGPSRRMDREDTAMANRAAFEREREMLLMQQQREREMKAKQAELVRAFQMECDRRNQKEEADRIAYEREQLEIERMKLERERIEAERLKLQLEQERRQYEREQLERSRNEMFENESRMPPKRSVEQNDVYWDYLAKKRRDSPAQPGMQGRDSGHDGSYENASVRLQQMATYGEGRPGENRIKESIPSGGGGGGGGSGGGAGNRPTGSMFHHQANSSADAGKSEWKSLYSTSDGGGSNTQSQWKTPASSSLGSSMNGRQFGSMSSFRDRPYQEDESPGGFGSGGFKGFGAGRGGNKWR